MLIRLLAALLVAMPIAAQAAPQSSIRAVEITQTAPAGTFGGVAFRRIQGVIHGVVAAGEPVAGLGKVAAGRDLVPYDAGFDMVMPDDPSQAGGVIVEANNRGMPVLLGMMSAPGAIAPPKASASGELKVEQGSAIRDGFLFAQHLSLAHVQWQSGIAPGVPQAAQGIGEVIVRDFGRLLGGAFPDASAGLPVFRHRILAGVSQSAWLVNSVIAEGFNVDPATGRGVYQGVFTRNGNGVATATPHSLPAAAPFVLTPALAEQKNINRLGATPLWLPKIGADGAARGGISMIDVAQPLGTPDPPALPPVGTSSINDTCGNFSGWTPFSVAELQQRYGSRAAYLAGARRQAATLVKTGYLLGQDEAAAVAQVEALLPTAFQ
jgi:hypothetical protein